MAESSASVQPSSSSPSPLLLLSSSPSSSAPQSNVYSILLSHKERTLEDSSSPPSPSSFFLSFYTQEVPETLARSSVAGSDHIKLASSLYSEAPSTGQQGNVLALYNPAKSHYRLCRPLMKTV